MKIFDLRLVFANLITVWENVQEMAWQVTIVILLVMLCRFFIGKVSKQACYVLWLVVAIRLLCPVMLPSDFSVFNWIDEPKQEQTTQLVPTQSVINDIENDSAKPTIMEPDADVGTNDDVVSNIANQMEITSDETSNVNQVIGTNMTPDASTVPNNLVFIKNNRTVIVWMLGMLLMLSYGVISYWRLRRKLRFATMADHHIFECDNIDSPFVFGVIRPHIYLPYHLSKAERDYILQHEKYHIKRRDYLVKLLAFGLLAVYWFHPLVWAAFYLMSRDMEMSCDEHVLKELGLEERKAYSTLLLSFASNKRFPLPSPLSFGENDVKSRIKQILSYKSPTLWGIIVVVALILVVAISCLTDAKSEAKEDTQVQLTDEEILSFAEELYHAKTPYIGDVSANGKILSLLREHYGVTRTNGNELQTYEEPFWITVGFDEKPDDTAMWKLASVFLALVENCSEFRWEFVAENDTLYTYYVETSDIETVLGCEDLKEYAETPEQIAELLMLLDEKETSVTKTMNDVSYTINKHLSYSLFSHYADKAGVPWEVANQYELRLMEDGVLYRDAENNAIYECIYKDFDNSGEMDMALYIRGLDYNDSTLHIYMNDDPLYTHVLPMSCWSMEILSGDIDHDGNTELVYSAFNGGNGGAGGYVKGILKYENHTFTQMDLPGDFSEEELADGDAGYHIEVYFGKEKDTYRVVVPSVKDFDVISSENFKNEDGSYIVKPYEGHQAGANCRGFYKLYIIQEKNQDYLMAEEYFHGEGGVNHSLGYIRFIFDWSDAEGWIVKGATAHPYIKSTTRDTDIFEAMKHEILYYPDDYEDLAQNWSNIPVINYTDGSVYEPYDQLTQYAYMTTRNMSTGSIIYAKLNEKEELTYVYVDYRDDKYYYLEDCTRVSDKPYYTNGGDYFQKVYNYGLYFAMNYPNGNSFEHFYLTNDEILSKDDIFDSRLSLQYASKFITVYTKELDDEGMEEYTRYTGDFIEQGIKITMPLNRSWIGDPVYKLSDGVVCGTYSDFHIDADMIVRVGEENAVFEKARAGLKESLAEWDYETWGAKTLDGEYIEIALYLEQLGATNYNTVVAKWEYEGNTYLLYGDTESMDGSPVAKTAAYIIEHFEKHE